MAEAIATKDKPVTFDRTDGRDELNLAEFPLFYLGQRVPKGLDTLTFQNVVHDPVRNRSVTRRFQLAASGAYGLPTAADADVLHSLMFLCKQASNLSSPVVTFSRYQLCDVLGWPKNGKSYVRIETALRKWVSLTLFFDSWWDKEDERWSNVQGFHLMEMFELNDVRGRRNEAELPLSTVRFSQEFFKSMKSGYVKKLNLAEYFHLKLPIAKQLYRFLDKRFYHRRSLTFELKNIAFEHIGLSRNYTPAKIKEKIRPAIDELVSIGFIEEMPLTQRFTKLRHGVYEVHFTKDKHHDIGDLPLFGSKAEKISNRQLIKELTDHGVTAATARNLVENPKYSEDCIRQKIEMLQWYQEKDPDEAPKKPGGWLRKAIVDDYSPPAGFQTKEEREAAQKRIADLRQQREQKEKARKAAEDLEYEQKKKQEAEEWQQVLDYLNALSESDRESLIHDAIYSDANSLYRKQSLKFREQGDENSRLYFEIALQNHIKPLMAS